MSRFSSFGRLGAPFELALTDSSSADWAGAPFRDHPWRCLSYSRIDRDLVKAVVATAAGEMWFSRRQLAEMLRERSGRAVRDASELMILHGLTCREIEAVQWIARGKANKEIAQTMSISDLTVKSHLKDIFKKCGLRRRGELPGQMMA
jgi:DNA-binding NarL/FixJ family response regulator